jgi:hypothetical protein
MWWNLKQSTVASTTTSVMDLKKNCKKTVASLKKLNFFSGVFFTGFAGFFWFQKLSLKKKNGAGRSRKSPFGNTSPPSFLAANPGDREH